MVKIGGWQGPVVAAALVVACGIEARHAAAQEFPTRPMRLLVGVAAGGGTDFVARMLAQRMNEAWGQPVIVDNRTGATGLIALELTAKAPPDGHTLIVFNLGHMMSAHLARKVTFDPVKAFTPVSLVANGTLLLAAHPSTGAKTVAELVTAARARPGQINYASGGAGSLQHLGAELLKREAKIDLVHVPYKGSGPGTLALLSGEVHLFIANMLPMMPHVRAGRLHALAVTTSTRSPAAPDVPTFGQAGYPAVDVSLWQGVLAPAGTPPAILEKISRQIATIVRTPEATRVLAEQGADPAGLGPAEFGQFLARERDKWLRVAREAKITLE
jgi:tripartite-type tricarboxylate transporter receptor subunit TctC